MGKEAVDANGKPCPKTTQTSDNQGTSETTRTAADELKSLGDSLNSDKSAESGKSADSANSGNSADSATNKDSGSKDKAKEGFGSQLAAYFSKMGKSLSNVLSPTADSGGAGATKVTNNSGLPVTEDSSTMHSNSTFNVPTGIQNIQVPDSFFVQVNKAINDLILNFASTLGIH